MFPKWTYQPGEADLTVMRIIIRGTGRTQAEVHTWDLFDVLDPATATTSMARTTAFPCAIGARMLLDGTVSTPGVLPPEKLAGTGVVSRVLDELAQRGVTFTHTVT